MLWSFQKELTSLTKELQWEKEIQMLHFLLHLVYDFAGNLGKGKDEIAVLACCFLELARYKRKNADWVFLRSPWSLGTRGKFEQ